MSIRQGICWTDLLKNSNYTSPNSLKKNFFFFYFTYLPWEISVITGFHYLPANKYNGDVELHIQNNTKLNDGVMR